MSQTHSPFPHTSSNSLGLVFWILSNVVSPALTSILLMLRPRESAKHRQGEGGREREGERDRQRNRGRDRQTGREAELMLCTHI